jgi:hypothetical protein
VFVHHEVGLTSVSDAWHFLVACGATLASTHGIQPHDIILGESRSLLTFPIRRQKKKVIVNCNDLICDFFFFFPKKTSYLIPALRRPPSRGLATSPVAAAAGYGSCDSPFGVPAFPQHGGFGAAPAFPHQGFGAQALSVPSIVYLITSSRPDFAAYITDDPMGRPRPRPTRSTSWYLSCCSG